LLGFGNFCNLSQRFFYAFCAAKQGRVTSNKCLYRRNNWNSSLLLLGKPAHAHDSAITRQDKLFPTRANDGNWESLFKVC
jgi:hypothetical protein